MSKSFDEYYNDGNFELARKGEHVIMKNTMSPERNKKLIKMIARKYPKLKRKINGRVLALRKKVSRCNPVELLSFCSDMSLIKMNGIESESQMTRQDIYSSRVTEYVQSIIVSTEYRPRKCILSLKENYREIIRETVKLHNLIERFYMSWAASLDEIHPEFDEKTRETLFESQLLFMVRGKRYQAFEIEYFQRLLSFHNDLFQSVFGLSSDEVVEGIKKLQFALSQGKFAVLNRLNKLLDEAHDSAVIEPEVFFRQHQEESNTLVEQLLGTKLRDVISVTGWPERFVDALSFGINDCPEFFDESEFSGWPVIDLPIQKRPFIKIDDHFYCFDYYSFIDNFYRAVQKAVKRTIPDYKWSDVQKEASESMVAHVFSQILPGSVIYRDNYFPKNKSTKNLFENDLIIIYAGILIIVEIKAGSFVFTSPIRDFEHHIVSYQSLIEKADHQCKNTYDYLLSTSTPIIYNSDATQKTQIDMSRISDIFMITVTIDNINDFAARAEKLNFLQLKCNAISLSIDDLMVYREYFDSPLVFLHYLGQRRYATQVEKLALNDELDHLGMYIKHNMYYIQMENYPDDAHVIFHGYREELDKYFSALYHPQLNPLKPSQDLPQYYFGIIDYLENSSIENKVEIANYLLCFSKETKQQLVDTIQGTLERQRVTKISSVSSFSGDDKYSLRCTLFIEQPTVRKLTDVEKREYVLSMLLSNEEPDRVMLVFSFDSNDQIVNLKFKKYIKDDAKANEYQYFKQQGKKRAALRLAQYIRQYGTIKDGQWCPCGSGKTYSKCCKYHS